MDESMKKEKGKKMGGKIMFFNIISKDASSERTSKRNGDEQPK